MLSRLSFRAKLLLVLFVPFLALVVVAAAGLSDRFSTLHAQQQYGDLSTPLQSLDDLSRALENESVVSAWFVAPKGVGEAELDRARLRTDDAVRQFRAEENGFARVGLSGDAGATLDEINRWFDVLTVGRTLVGSAPGAGSEYLLGIDDDVLRFGTQVARDLADHQASASLTRSFSLQREEHELASEATTYAAVLADGTQQDSNRWVGASAAQLQSRALFTETASGAELSAFDQARGTSGPLPSAFEVGVLGGDYYVAAYHRRAHSLDEGIAAVNSEIRGSARARAATALTATRVYGGATVIAMLLTLGLIWFVTRTVIRPVRRLTRAAREMSRRRLPQLVEALRTGGDVGALQPTPIEVVSEDELGELARAFHDVEAVTMEVALEQSRLLRKGMSDLFVNLARRNQGLLERQLELLDDLERNEHDPAALDALFKLDHMATRMRRNAESLLVLSGSEQPRQWHDPIALLDVVRAAAAEIADFPRVELVGVDPSLSVAGRAVADVAHMLAELLENATSCSPPDRPVVVSGAATNNGFVLAVSDQGIGMPIERIVESNRLLAHPPVVGLALSRALGLHVVGLLAARHGITVELRPGAPVGMVALVMIPHAVLEEHAGPSSPTEPMYLPQLDTAGAPEALGARRMPSRPADEPPVEEWRREGLGEPVTAADPAAATPGSYDPPGAASDAPHLESQPQDESPLPTRVPGNHLSHRPTGDAGDGVNPVEVAEAVGPVEADPLRPYRVHEFLTRHAQGKERGRAGDHIPEDAA